MSQAPGHADVASCTPHTVEQVAPGCLVITLCGDVSAEHARSLSRLAREVADEAGELQVLADLRRMGKVSKAAKHAFQDGLGDVPVGRVGIVGLGRAVRSLARLAIGAVNLVRRARVRVAFFQGSEDALQWVAQRAS